MKFATPRQSEKFGVDATDSSDTVWLRRARVGAKRPGDFLVVVLSAGVILTLGLVVVIARFESAGSEPASRVAAVQQPVLRAAPAAQPTSPPVAVPSSQAAAPQAAPAAPAKTALSAQPAPDLQAAAPAPFTGAPVVTPVAPRPAPVSTASVPTPPAAVTPAPITQPIEVSRQTPPRGGARFDPALAFAAPTFPTGDMPAELESLAAAEAAREPGREPARELVREPTREPVQTARLTETAEPQPAPAPTRREAAQPVRQAAANAGEPVAKKGSAGATWAVYFDQFPDQSTAASRIGALQGKYGPHLGGRTLTYTRSGDDWRLRVSGLTEEAARSICDKVKSAGSNCAVGGR